MLAVEGEEMFPQGLRLGVHEQRALLVERDVFLDVHLFAELDVLGVRAVLADFHAGLVDGGDEAETDGERLFLGRALVDLLDAVIP